MTIKRGKALFITSTLVAALSATPLWAQTSTTETNKLAGTYSTFAGSSTNSTALVTGLRDGKTITLTSATPGVSSATFTPATSQLGYGNVNLALSLAQAELTKLGTTNPTPAQLQAALNGGTVTTTTGTKTLSGILQLRNSGMGWGQIANSLGYKLGDVVSSSKTEDRKSVV